eukprot:CAMPEP_0198733694 /NCGR_PEP_ID=MMETSP1475-20131203/47620_1 /TAXON_ID= ORGANISM="Unidentified sp., Strain CCMP1999" /NCGR_SAMPLE_ID=MMETSP1475 /ASSEMBLY_ACC=CAM_ASM_001111 /LENGTH=81 /DNA_ID=CAMNT_0044497031 /DNA_START=286 /DNA_END=532 /DNA_ORIENTATION=+
MGGEKVGGVWWNWKRGVVVWERPEKKAELNLAEEGDKELEVECDCAPLWQCMTEPQPGQDCAKLESELRACMARATASRAS